MLAVALGIIGLAFFGSISGFVHGGFADGIDAFQNSFRKREQKSKRVARLRTRVGIDRQFFCKAVQSD